MNGSTQTLVIINHRAARSARAWPTVRELLKRHGIRFDVHETRHAGDATTATRAALREGRRYSVIAVVGGDGTLSEAAAGFFDTAAEREDPLSLPSPINKEAVLAIIPAGTGDDFARGLLFGKRESAERWAMRLVAHRRDESTTGGGTRMVDVIWGHAEAGAGEFICLNAATIGIGAEVASRVARQQGFALRLPGEARFVQAALGALMGWRERRAVVSIYGVGGDGPRVIECASNLIAIANGTYAGGGMMFAPGAKLDDGRMDLVVAADGLTRAMILRELPRIRRGAHLSNPKVRILQAKGVQVKTPDEALLVEADGNLRGHTPASFRILPAALRVVAEKQGGTKGGGPQR
ncbi:MAG TPA: diacylglycerol kinase family protein [Pyrinomonadaceae bacterium]|jgi:diacylglycerol kinase family enzyme|nr:diacylglycerol kinase family protein [Pyrinomonadaceae bacterium]